MRGSEALTAPPPDSAGGLKDLRKRAGEYLCRGADAIRDAAGYIFRGDEEAMKRYPCLYKNQAPRTQKPEEESEPEGAPLESAEA